MLTASFVIIILTKPTLLFIIIIDAVVVLLWVFMRHLHHFIVRYVVFVGRPYLMIESGYVPDIDEFDEVQQ